MESIAIDEEYLLDLIALPREERLTRSGSPSSICALVLQPIIKTDETEVKGSSKPDRKPLQTNRLVPVEAIKEEQERNAKDAAEHLLDLRRQLELSDPRKATFVIAHVTVIAGHIQEYYIPAEIGLTAFNLQDGIIDNYWSLIDHESIKLGFRIEVESEAPKVGLPIPPFDYRCRDYEKIISNIDQFMQKHSFRQSRTRKIYCLKKNMKQVSISLGLLYDQRNKDNPYAVYSFEQLVRCMSMIGDVGEWRSRYDPKERKKKKEKKYSEREARGIPGEDEVRDILREDEVDGIDEYDSDLSDSVSFRGRQPEWGSENFVLESSPQYLTTDQMANEWLNSDRYAYVKGVGCPYHWTSDNNSTSCALNVTNRLAYNAIAVLFDTFRIKTQVSYHCTDDKYEDNEVKRRMELLSHWDIPVYYMKDFIKHRKDNNDKNSGGAGGPSARAW